MLNLFYVAVTIGTTVLDAQYWGKGDKDSVELVLAISLKVSTLISALFFLAVSFFPHLIMRLFTGDGLLMELAV